MDRNTFLLLVYPAYFLVLFFLIKYFSMLDKEMIKLKDIIEQQKDLIKNQQEIFEKLNKKLEQKDIVPIKEEVKVVKEKVEDVKEEVKEIKKDNIEIRNEIVNTQISIASQIKREIEESLSIKAYMSNEEQKNFDREIVLENQRRAADMDIFDKKIRRVVDDVMNIFFKDRYLGNAESYDLSTGEFNLPRITDETKVKDVQDIYVNFMKIINKNFLINDLSMIYDMEEVETKVFLMETYIIPAYSDRLSNMIASWQEIQETKAKNSAEAIRQQAEERAKEMEEERLRKSEVGKLMNKIDKIYEEIQ